MKLRIILFLVLICGIPESRAPAQAAQNYLAPKQMYDAMQSSNTVYAFESLQALKGMSPEAMADIYWPSAQKPMEYPWVSEDHPGSLRLTTYPFEGGCRDILKNANVAYGNKEKDRAAELYRKALAASPKCYYAYYGLGNVLLTTSGDAEKALELYQKSIDLNPYDASLFFIKGMALTRLKRPAEAKESFIRGLTLRPRDKSMIETLKMIADPLGISVAEEPFQPKSLARLEGEKVAIYADPKDLPWFAYAICKAYWLGEPQYRKEMTGEQEHHWSSTEELQCVSALIDGYLGGSREGKIPKDPAIERLKLMVDDGMLAQFVLYEIGSRITPNEGLLIPALERDKLEGYIAKYVLVPKGVSSNVSKKEDAPSQR